MPSVTGLRDLAAGPWIPWSPSCMDTCKQVSPVAGPDLWLHQQLNPRPHGAPSHWLEPPGPSSNQQADLLLSPAPSPELEYLQYLAPKPLILLAGYSSLMFPSARTLT